MWVTYKKNGFLSECQCQVSVRLEARKLTDEVRGCVLPGRGYRWVWSNSGVEIRRGKPKGLWWNLVPAPLSPRQVNPHTHETNPDWNWESATERKRRTVWTLNDLNNQTEPAKHYVSIITTAQRSSVYGWTPSFINFLKLLERCFIRGSPLCRVHPNTYDRVHPGVLNLFLGM